MNLSFCTFMPERIDTFINSPLLKSYYLAGWRENLYFVFELQRYVTPAINFLHSHLMRVHIVLGASWRLQTLEEDTPFSIDRGSQSKVNIHFFAKMVRLCAYILYA